MSDIPVTPRPGLARGLAFLSLAAAGGMSLLGLPSELYNPALALAVLATVLLLRRGSPEGVGGGLALLVIAGSLTLGAVDLAGRVLLDGRLNLRPHDRLVHRWPPEPRLSRYYPRRSLEMEISGDLAAMTGDPAHQVPRTVTFETDARGFRNPPEDPPGGYSLVILGDSFGVGTGSDTADTWASRLRDHHRRPTYSLSMPGSPWHELMNLRAELPDLPLRDEAVVLWAIFDGNDLDGEYHDDLVPRLRLGALQAGKVGFKTFRNRSPLRRIVERALHGYQGATGSDVEAWQAPGPAPFLIHRVYQERAGRDLAALRAHDHLPRLRRVMAEMAAVARARGLRVLVAALPDKTRVYRGGPSEPLAVRERVPPGFETLLGELAREQGFAFLDLRPALAETAAAALAEGDLLWWPDDTHWGPRGHAVAAARVDAELSRLGISPDR